MNEEKKEKKLTVWQQWEQSRLSKLVSIQPMTAPTGQIFSFGTRNYKELKALEDKVAIYISCIQERVKNEISNQ